MLRLSLITPSTPFARSNRDKRRSDSAMEQQLQAWLRICTFFGGYVSARKYTDGDKSIDGRGSANSRAYWLQRAYNCLLFLSICVVFACSLCWLTIPPGLELNWVAVSILFATRFITNAFILMEAVCKQQQHANFLKALQAIETSLRLRLKWRVESTTLLSQIKRMLKYHLALSVLGMVPFMVATWVFVDYGGYFWQGLWYICSIRVRTLQLLVYLRILRHYLRDLCLQLQQLVAYHRTPQRCLLDFNYGRLGTLRHLLAIKETYMLFYEASELLNAFAGWSLFGIVITSVLDLSSNFYWLLQSFDNFHGRRYYFLADLWWFLPVIALICELCYLCDSCRQLVYVCILHARKNKISYTYRAVLWRIY